MINIKLPEILKGLKKDGNSKLGPVKKENKEKLEKEIKSIEEKLFKKRKEFELNKDAILSTNF